VDDAAPRSGVRRALAALAESEPAQWAVPCSVAVVAARARLRAADLGLSGLSDRTLGHAVAAGADVAARTWLVLETAVLALAAALAVFGAARWLSRRIAAASPGWRTRGRAAMRPMQWLAAAAAVCVIADARSGTARGLFVAGAYAGLLGLAVALPRVPGARSRPATLHALAIAGLLVGAFGAAVALRRPVGSPAALSVGFALATAFVCGVPRLFARRGRWGGGTERRVAACCAPLALLPLGGLVAQESATALWAHWEAAVNYRSAWLCFAGGLVLAGVALARRAGPAGRGPARWLRGWIAPCAVIALAAAAGYLQAGSPLQIDPFHLGEKTLPYHQWARWGRWPYGEMLPTHGLLTDFFMPMFTAWTDGGHRIDGALLVHWPVRMLAAAGLYGFVRRVTRSTGLAALAAVCVPALVGQKLDYAAGLAGLVVLAWACERPSARRALALGAAVAGMAVVRHDVGLFTAVTVLPVFAVMMLARDPRSGSAWRTVGAACAVPAAAAVVLLAIVQLRSADPGHTLAMVQQFFSLRFQSDAQGLARLLRPGVPLPASRFFHFVMPGLAVLLGTVLAARTATALLDGRRARPAAAAAVALVGFNLLVFLRAFGRHTEFEQGVTVFLTALSPLTLGALWWLLTTQSARRTAGVAAVVGATLLAGGPTVTPAGQALRRDVLPARHRPVTEGPLSVRYRVAPPVTAGYTALREFIDRHAPPPLTFDEFGNMPFLHLWCDRPAPGYLMPELYTVSETMQRDRVAQLDPANVPVVVEYSRTWWRDMDGMPDRVRNYRLYEHLFAHWRPYGFVGPYFVWTTPGVPAPAVAPPASAIDRPIELGGLAVRWAQHDPLRPLVYTPVEIDFGGALAAAGRPAPVIAPRTTLRIDRRFTPGRANYLHLTLESAVAGRCAVTYLRRGTERPWDRAFKFDVPAGSKPVDAVVRPSVQWSWHAGGPIDAVVVRNLGNRPLRLHALRLRTGD
jgi:hypothetical protein